VHTVLVQLVESQAGPEPATHSATHSQGSTCECNDKDQGGGGCLADQQLWPVDMVLMKLFNGLQQST
jgi:hypothetical protein